MTSKRTNKGFSLVELLVVIGVIALLATIGTIAATSFARKAKQQKTYAFMDLLMGAILTYQESTGVYINTPTIANPNPSNFWYGCNTSEGDKVNGYSKNIYYVLQGDQSAFDKVKQMPTDAFIIPSGQTTATGFQDGWGNPMYYNPIAGMGGTPALMSYGADGVTGAVGSTAAKDDVYSYRK